MAPLSPLPYSDTFSDPDTYVESLLNFATSSSLFQTLCGGVHILDFFTREPDLYATVLPGSWREWLQERGVEDILDLLMRENLDQFATTSQGTIIERQQNQELPWRGGPRPPESLLCYIQDIRKHLLRRDFQPPTVPGKLGLRNAERGNLSRKIAVGMKPKKIHEVQNFAQYVDDLASEISRGTSCEITHLVDFGSGQNYLGRALASQPYHRHIVAVESKKHNIEGAKSMDITARLAEKGKLMRHKREYRSQIVALNSGKGTANGDPATPEDNLEGMSTEAVTEAMAKFSLKEADILYLNGEGKGSVQYVEHMINGADLSPVVRQIKNVSRATGDGCAVETIEKKGPGRCDNMDDLDNRKGLERPLFPRTDVHGVDLGNPPEAFNGDIHLASQEGPPADISASALSPQSLMIISLHSCGSLVHHALRSLIFTPSVTAVAVIGCCYNLMTERLGPPTYKLPTLRPCPNPRVVATSAACDPDGFPMSERQARYLHGHGEGVRLNITARMMAVQAPQNWTPASSADFFTRHFFRALLQRIFLDRGVVSVPSAADDIVGGCPTSPDAMGTEPIIIGSLRKACYTSFVSYVRGAVTKLSNNDPVRGPIIASLMSGLSDNEIADYHTRYLPRKKDLSTVWSLMAFSAGVVEAIVVVDRWLFLKEQRDVIKDAWVETVFDYQQSPRNLVVVGVKKSS
ncbi:hypothetical protein FGG08_000057 [Glutinoglossum americanum]|uniref:Methyltransferase domain-containing protein n=1 Tax=Glutinoglossum americanum TaxID=1670608 RepID=A0A9P8L443_9PEZI|nr:hypothetical protein FGG08_000057 [Glutinoglossum americanum]